MKAVCNITQLQPSGEHDDDDMQKKKKSYQLEPGMELKPFAMFKVST